MSMAHLTSFLFLSLLSLDRFFSVSILLLCLNITETGIVYTMCAHLSNICGYCIFIWIRETIYPNGILRRRCLLHGIRSLIAISFVNLTSSSERLQRIHLFDQQTKKNSIPFFPLDFVYWISFCCLRFNLCVFWFSSFFCSISISIKFIL